MNWNSIHYRKGYKYQLVLPYSVQTDIRPGADIVSPTGLFGLTAEGLLWVNAYYAWDGASGPAIDTNTIQRGGLCHDVLYQMMRDGLLDIGYRGAADALLRQLCIEDGMLPIRALYVYYGVRFCGKVCALPEHENKVITAP
jgi:hypothetical protein